MESMVRLNVCIARTGLALIAVQKGDRQSAIEQYTFLELLRGMLLPRSVLSADHVLGLLAQTTGEIDSAQVHFEEALSFCRNAGYRPELAWTCYDYAKFRFEQGQLKESGTLLDEALSISSELAMLPLTEKVTNLQEELEARPASTPAYPDGLTGREAEVLQLIAAGKTNREIGDELFISVNTVVRHVSNIFSKTATSNRTEAARYANSKGLS